ncbi:stalk domain-containing protein [Caminicella sporogenes]|uniref:stalk domain-containing protein n=1 Tax=Caminicella sporogenes TaxID=166485 RepID=UPI0025415B52|nr:stalk domain-containing protein [Caminicella sporogenes]WIF96029.1 stalk domain-containing protein [Caminicella sporogenes]
MNHKIKRAVCLASVSALFFVAPLSSFGEEYFKTDFDTSDNRVKAVFKINSKEYSIGDTKKSIDSAPYIKDGRTMLPVRYVADAVGIAQKDIVWNPEDKTVTIFKGDKIIQLTIGSNILSTDTEKITMDTEAEIKDDRTFVPVSYIAKALGVEVDWDDTDKEVTFYLDREIKKEAEENSKSNYDYDLDMLYKKALESSNEYKIAQATLEKNEILKDDAEDDLDYVPSIGETPAGSPAEALASVTFLKVENSRIEYRKAEKDLKALKDKINYQVKSAYYDVIKAQNSLDIAKEALNLYKKSMEQSQLKYKLGIISKTEETKAVKEYEKAKETYEKALKNLDMKYQKLNKLVGFEPEKRYVLDTSLRVKLNDDNDPESHIGEIIEEIPDIWYAEQKAKLAGLSVDVYVFNVGNPPYAAAELDEKTAKMTVAEAKKNTKQSLRDLFNSMKILEKQYREQVAEIEKAREDLETAELNFKVGNTIELVVDKAKLNYDMIKNDIKNTIMDYDLLNMVYEKPWVSSGQ